MSPVEMVMEKIKGLDEARARQLLTWFDNTSPAQFRLEPRRGAAAMLGFARHLRSDPRTTAGWMAGLREGETE